MALEGHYDPTAGIAWFRSSIYAGERVVAVETDAGLREFDQLTGRTVGLECWNATVRLPQDLLDALDRPPA